MARRMHFDISLDLLRARLHLPDTVEVKAISSSGNQDGTATIVILDYAQPGHRGSEVSEKITPSVMHTRESFLWVWDPPPHPELATPEAGSAPSP